MDAKIAAMIAALKEAMLSPEPLPLYRIGKGPGLFSSRGGSSGEAAEEAVQLGLLEVVRQESRGKQEQSWVRITPRGVEFVYEHESPRQVLEELRDLLKTHTSGVPRWAEEIRAGLQALINRYHDLLDRQQTFLTHLRHRVDAALERLEKSEPLKPLDTWQLDALAYLDRRSTVTGPAPCPLRELFQALRERHPHLELSAFHAGLSELQERESLRLIPLTGSLSDLPEPEFALLEGTEVYHAVQRP